MPFSNSLLTVFGSLESVMRDTVHIDAGMQ